MPGEITYRNGRTVLPGDRVRRGTSTRVWHVTGTVPCPPPTRLNPHRIDLVSLELDLGYALRSRPVWSFATQLTLVERGTTHA